MRIKPQVRTLASAQVTAGRALWQTGDTHQRYVFSATFQPTAAQILVTDEAGSAADEGIIVASQQVWSQGNVESRGSDTQLDLGEIYVKGATDVVLYAEVLDDNTND